jgi:hypothetical protein
MSVRMVVSRGYGFSETGGAVLDAPTLSVADNEDGTGAVATIADSTSGTTNNVYCGPWTGLAGDVTFTAEGSRLDDGTVSLSLDVGSYFAYVLSVLGTDTIVSNLVRFDVTDADIDSVYWDCLVAVRDRIAALALPGSPSVVIRKIGIDSNLGLGKDVTLPAVLVIPRFEVMNPTAGTNEQDDVAYDIWVVIVEADNREITLAHNLDRRLAQRELIAREFRNQRLSGVDTVFTCSVQPADVTIKDAWGNNLFASAQLLRFMSRETRGN